MPRRRTTGARTYPEWMDDETLEQRSSREWWDEHARKHAEWWGRVHVPAWERFPEATPVYHDDGVMIVSWRRSTAELAGDNRPPTDTPEAQGDELDALDGQEVTHAGQ